MGIWFANASPEVKNPDGTPKKLYHFTEDGSWLVDPDSQFMATEQNPTGIIYMSDRPGFVYDSEFGKPGATIIEMYSNLKNPWMPESGSVSGLKHGKAGARMVEILKAEGYDGAINVADGEWVAFYPENVKPTKGIRTGSDVFQFSVFCKKICRRSDLAPIFKKDHS